MIIEGNDMNNSPESVRNLQQPTEVLSSYVDDDLLEIGSSPFYRHPLGANLPGRFADKFEESSHRGAAVPLIWVVEEPAR